MGSRQELNDFSPPSFVLTLGHCQWLWDLCWINFQNCGDTAISPGWLQKISEHLDQLFVFENHEELKVSWQISELSSQTVPGLVPGTLEPWNPPFTPEASLRLQTWVYQRLQKTVLPEISMLQPLSFPLGFLWEKKNRKPQTHRYPGPLELCNTYSLPWTWFRKRHSCLQMIWNSR